MRKWWVHLGFGLDLGWRHEVKMYQFSLQRDQTEDCTEVREQRWEKRNLIDKVDRQKRGLHCILL